MKERKFANSKLRGRIINKRNAFTLIELLAIIVILAIIAVITVPIILNIIDNSRKGAMKDSAYGYKDAINKYYLTKLSENPDWNELDGTYSINSDGNLIKSATETYNITVSGQHPTDGYVVIQGKQTSGCLVYGDYAVTINNGKVTNTIKGNCKFTKQDDAATTGELTIGDLVCINDTEECFYVISNEDGITSMLARYNLKVGSNVDFSNSNPISNIEENESGYGMQDENSTGMNKDNVSRGAWNSVQYFSLTNYWKDNVGYGLKYGGDTSTGDFPYVYDENSSLYPYVNNYKIDLEKNGIIISKARLMTYEEANNFKNSNSEELFMTAFWLGNSVFSDSKIFFVGSSGAPTNIINSSNSTYSMISHPTYGNIPTYGVRPVIEIPTSAIELKK